MLAVLRDDGNELTTRLDAAKAAAPYCHAKRAPVDGEGKEVSLTVIIQKPGA
jgi:hypothetical protein